MLEIGAGLGAAAILGASARWNWWRPRTSGIPSLMYHKVGDYPPNSQLKKLWASAGNFRKHMKYLKDKGYTSLLLAELLEIEMNKRPMPTRPVLITFDDGYANNYEVAYPLLKEFGMKGNIFLVCETMDGYNSWHNPASESWLSMLTWAQIREMQDSGVVEFGSHTMRHRNLDKISLEDARWELEESKKRLEDKLGRPMVGFAYPYGAGAYNPDVRRLARAAGYHYDFGIRQGISSWPWSPDSGPLKRLFIRGDDGMLDFHLQMTRGKAYF